MKKIILLLIIAFPIITIGATYEDALELFKKKQYKDSLKVLAENLVVADDLVPNSSNYNLRFLAAHNHWKLGNTNSVVTHFKRCMDIKKDTVEPYIDLALFMIEIKRYNEAERIVVKGLSIKKEAMLYYVLVKQI